MSQQFLRFRFKATEYNGWPKIRIMFNGDVYEEVTLSQPEQFVEVPLNLPSGKHLLEIERYDKTDNNVLFVDGQILQDQTVELADIYVDDIKLGNLFKYNNAVFKHRDGEIVNSYIWGLNGTFSWSFETPIIPWLIKVKQTLEDDNINLYIPGRQNTTELTNLIEKIESAINGFKI